MPKRPAPSATVPPIVINNYNTINHIHIRERDDFMTGLTDHEDNDE
jgi:hypothetical protein